jgi:hypothetical protein
MKKYKLFLFLAALLSMKLQAQELQAKVTVLSQKVATTVDKKIFNTLQTQLTNLLNNRKWTRDEYKPQERIECNFLLNIEGTDDQNIYRATLTVQAARPVFNASYQSAMVNFQDADITFKYVEFQPIEFNENRVSGTDPLAANLTATLAYYVYIILGMDYDSFSPKGGEPFFKQAQNIVNNSPESRSITGWKVFDGLRNRYWLTENIMNTRYNILHDVIYNYYRTGLDAMYDDEVSARENILDALSKLDAFNKENPNSMFVQFFMQSKFQEMTGIFKKSSPETKSRALELLSKLDITNSNKYRGELR